MCFMNEPPLKCQPMTGSSVHCWNISCMYLDYTFLFVYWRRLTFEESFTLKFTFNIRCFSS